MLQEIGEAADPVQTSTEIDAQWEAGDAIANVEPATVATPNNTLKQTTVDAAFPLLGRPLRRRNRHHLKFVSTQPCLACGRHPSDAHHIKFAQERAMGRKVSDEYTVPLCRVHHRELHRRGDERIWWEQVNIDPLKAAERLWMKTQLNGQTPTARQGSAADE
jgi:hypothetical protein